MEEKRHGSQCLGGIGGKWGEEWENFPRAFVALVIFHKPSGGLKSCAVATGFHCEAKQGEVEEEAVEKRTIFQSERGLK